jgi:hypothetical protein
VLVASHTTRPNIPSAARFGGSSWFSDPGVRRGPR